MSSAKRYNFDQTGCPEEDQDGGYVESSDYDALAAKAERYIQEGISLADQRDALAAECQRLRELLARIRGAQIPRATPYWFDEIDAALAAECQIINAIEQEPQPHGTP